MKKLVILMLLLSMPALVCAESYDANWDKDEPDGDTRYIDQIDNYVISNNQALDRLLANYVSDCQMRYDSASQFTVQDGEIVCSNSDGSVRVFTRNTSSTTVTWADIDTGAEAANTTYYAYAVAASTTATTFTVSISTSSSAPSGATYYKRLGSFLNDSSSNITQIKNDSYFQDLGAWESKSKNTVYQATTDGIAIGYAPSGGGQQVYIYTDGSNPPTTKRFETGGDPTSGNYAAIAPVKKGDYWEIDSSASVTVYWVSLD